MSHVPVAHAFGVYLYGSGVAQKEASESLSWRRVGELTLRRCNKLPLGERGVFFLCFAESYYEDFYHTFVVVVS